MNRPAAASPKLKASIPRSSTGQPKPRTAARISPQKPDAIGTKRRPPKKARNSGSLIAPKRL